MTKKETESRKFTPDETGYLRVETYRSGFFEFQIGLDFEKLKIPHLRVEEAYARFASMPLVGDVANQLEKTTLVTSVYSTNTIEGGDLSETETQEAMDLSPGEAQKESEKRVVNLKEAYKIAEEFPKSLREKLSKENKEKAKVQGWFRIDVYEFLIEKLHKIITNDLKHEDNIPGEYRNNPKSRKTQVGDEGHGGVYTPPKCLDDIKLLIEAFEVWANSEPVMKLPPLYRAPLLHYYLELIHPFWDGNGRTGRVIEAFVAQAASYRYAPFAVARYYLDNIDKYFTLFNSCRKLAKSKDPTPNTEFVSFYLDAMLSSINRLHDRANEIISLILYNSQLNILYSQKKLNTRQYTIINTLLANYNYQFIEKLKIEPWYKSLYSNLTEKTRKRDLKKLEELDLIKIKNGKKINMAYAEPGIKLSEYPLTARLDV